MIMMIITMAFSVEALGGGLCGTITAGMMNAMRYGVARGVFSNEAGLGSSVMVHSNSNIKEPVKQGMWGIFEVFADTMVVCTMTALVVLTSGVLDLDTGALMQGATDANLVAKAFSTLFGVWGERFIAIAILLFAYSTVLGWSHYGSKAFEFLFGTKATIGYKLVFVVMAYFGCTMSLSLALDLSDTFNGLMMVPNLIGVVALSGLVMKITRNYIDRVKKGKDIKPMISVFPEIQEEQEKEL